KSQPACVEVTGLDSATLSQLRDHPPTNWPATLAVFVGDSRTPIVGSYSVTNTVLRFEPRFPFTPGLKYRGVFAPASGSKIEFQFTVAEPATKTTTLVEQVYPSSDKLPENLLKFYLHFSAPMSFGQAYMRVHLIDAEGKAVERPF